MEISLYSYGGHSEGETPGSIPNPEAKPFSADGTALVTVWESRTPPDIHCERASTGNNRSRLFHVCRKIVIVGELTNDCTQHPRRMEPGLVSDDQPDRRPRRQDGPRRGSSAGRTEGGGD